MVSDPVARGILQAEIARSDKLDPKLCRALGNFLDQENLFFVAHLYFTGKHVMVERVFDEMNRRLVSRLTQSLSSESRDVLMQDLSDDQIIHLFHDHPDWELYTLLHKLRHTGFLPLDCFRYHGERLRIAQANEVLQECIRTNDVEGIWKNLEAAHGEVQEQAIRLLKECDPQRMVGWLRRYTVEHDPFLSAFHIQDTLEELEAAFVEEEPGSS